MKLFLLSLLLYFGSVFSAVAQNEEWRLLRAGNKAFGEKQYATAEKYYKQALKANTHSSRAAFNLGDAYLAQNKAQEALKQYEKAAQNDKNKIVRAMAFHNMGYIHHVDKKYDEAIAAYKKALRNNPRDEDTRYNLTLALKQKSQQKQQDKQESQKDNKQEQQKQKDKNKDKQQEDKNQKQNSDKAAQKSGMSKENIDALLQMTRQAEEQTLEKIKNNQKQLRPKQLDKNW